MAAPLIRTLLPQGGTFYAFTSAANDLTKTFNNDDLKFEFSKFALLNLPDIDVPVHKENFIQFNTIDGSIFNELNPDNNINISESFQNYVLNFESLILDNDDYNPNIKQTVAERLFFKWLKELGAIRFNEASDTQVNTLINDKRFVEERTVDSGTQRYQRVVEYLGDINAINNVQKSGQTYTELYLNVPTKVGNTPTVLFDSVSDDNYYPSMIMKGTTELINGRLSTTIHPDALSLNAFYDYDRYVDYTDDNANWYNAGTGAENCYFTELNDFENIANIEITKTYSDYQNVDPGLAPFSDINYLRTSLDGITLDFESESYYDIVTDSKIESILEYNSALKSQNFEFNTILLYYDIYNSSNPSERTRNLYGVIFLNNITPLGNTNFIQRLIKNKPNGITGLNGNSYGLKLNLKFDTSIDNVGIETIINDYSTFSMDLFIDASTQLQDAATILLETQTRFLDIINKVNDLERLIFSSENVTELTNRVNELESNLQNSQLALDDSTTLLDLIAHNSDRIQEIVSGNTPLTLQYNTDVLKSGLGIKLDKSTPNSIKVENNNQTYKLNQIYTDEYFNDLVDNSNMINLNQNIDINIYAKLKTFTNYFRLYTENIAYSDLKLFIDDSNILFKDGQSLRITFNTNFELNDKVFYIYTDKKNRLGNGVYGTLVGIILGNELIHAKPIIEIICVDETSYKFDVDIIR